MEAHFNYWRIAGDKSFEPADGSIAADFIEVGILIDDASRIELARIFVPLYVDPQFVADCSPYFQSVEVSQGIFNEVLTVTAPPFRGPRCVELLKADRSVFARVHCFAQDDGGISSDELSIVHQDDGSLITIDPRALMNAAQLSIDGAATYFRLRLYVMPGAENPLVRVLPTPDKLFQSSYEEIEYLDFRVNEARTLPEAIEQQMRTDQGAGCVRTRLIAFLTAVPVKSQLSVSNTPSHKMRLLEHDLWNEYVPGGLPHGMVVYHWKRESASPHASSQSSRSSRAADVRDFTAFVKLQTKQSSRGIWIGYLVVAFLIGVAGNLASEAVEYFFSHASAPTTQPVHHRPPPTHPQLPPPPLRGTSSANSVSGLGNVS